MTESSKLINQVLDKLIGYQIRTAYEKNIQVSQGALAPADLEKLVQVLKALPEELRTLVLVNHYFHQGPSSAKEVFAIDQAKEKYAWTRQVLSQSLGLEDRLIKDEDLALACQRLMAEEKEKLKKLPQVAFKPSKTFKNKMKLLGIKIQRPRIQILKRVAVIFLVLFGSASIFFITNTAARTKVYDWIIKDYGSHSTFTFEQLEETDEEILGLDDLQISYIPESFKLYKTQTSNDYKRLTYAHKKNEKTVFTIRMKKISANNNLSAYKTSFAEVNEIYVNDYNGYYWHNDLNYLLWQQNGLEILISGPISKEELIKIAENIYN
ncbi:MAG: DUF4367 domain-containing protein [Bacillota bacterium]|nr:DUF4367 domain-containing protein [Bacillota bacterium]